MQETRESQEISKLSSPSLFLPPFSQCLPCGAPFNHQPSSPAAIIMITNYLPLLLPGFLFSSLIFFSCKLLIFYAFWLSQKNSGLLS